MPDEEGFELPSPSAACTEALAVVRELTNPELSGGSRRWASWFLEVADDNGRFFRTPIGHPALEVVTPEAPPAVAGKAVCPIRRTTQDPLAKGRAAEIVRQMLPRCQQAAQLLQDDQALRRDLSKLFLLSRRIRIP